MDFDKFRERFCPNLSVEEYIEAGHNTTCKARKGDENVFVKYTDLTERIPDLRCEYEVNSILSDHTDLFCPKPVLKIDKNNRGIMIITSYETINVPSADSWSEEEYCKRVIDSGVNLFNTFHNDSEFLNIASQSDLCCRFVSRYNLFKSDIEKSRDIDGLNQYSDKCLKAYKYLNSKNNKFTIRFNHNDLNLSQLGFTQGIMPILDLEHFGLSDPCYDISRFEASIIDEMILEVHGRSFADKMRKRLHENLTVNLQSLKRYRAYKLLNTLTASIFVANGYCSEYWLEVGSQDRCFELKKQQLSSINL
jgi:hypothetical protein